LENGVAAVISAVEMMPLTGKPPPMPLPIVMMSGSTPECSLANIVPVRPKPVMISSTMSSAPTSCAISLTPRRNSGGGTTLPAVPWMGSIRIAAMLPAHAVSEAVTEARRAVKGLGTVAVYLRPNFVNGVPWHDPSYRPLWAELQELNVPVGFHEGTGSDLVQDGSEFGDNRLMRHACSHPIGMMKAMISVICGGVFEAFPRLRVGFLEANTGWVPFWLARMERDVALYREWDAPFLTLRPSEYFRRNCWVGCEGEEKELGYVVAEIGDTNIVFSTDYPHHDSEFPHSVEAFLELPIQEAGKRKILWDNCACLYCLG